MRKPGVSVSAGVFVVACSVAAASPTAEREPSSVVRPQRSGGESVPAVDLASLRVDQLIQSSQFAPTPGHLLLAQRDAPAFYGDNADESGASGSSRPERASALPAAAARELGVELPRPGRASATLATLALGLFFFLRRVV